MASDGASNTYEAARKQNIESNRQRLIALGLFRAADNYLGCQPVKKLATESSTVRRKAPSAPPIHIITRAMTAPIVEWLESVLGGYESVKPSIQTLAEHLFEQEIALPRLHCLRNSDWDEANHFLETRKLAPLKTGHINDLRYASEAMGQPSAKSTLTARLQLSQRSHTIPHQGSCRENIFCPVSFALPSHLSAMFGDFRCRCLPKVQGANAYEDP